MLKKPRGKQLGGPPGDRVSGRFPPWAGGATPSLASSIQQSVSLQPADPGPVVDQDPSQNEYRERPDVPANKRALFSEKAGDSASDHALAVADTNTFLYIPCRD